MATDDDYQTLRLKQLDRALQPFVAARNVARPQRGWIRAIRQAIGVSAAAVAQTLGTSRSLPLQLERWEANDRITLKSLRSVANALDCDLVYALVPRSGSLQTLLDSRAGREATQRVRRVEHTMALEDQAAGGMEAAIDEETRRILRKRTAE